MTSIYELIPTKNDVTKIVSAKVSFDQAKKNKTPTEFNKWLNQKNVFFEVAPRGISYSTSKASYDSYTKLCKDRRWKMPIMENYTKNALKYFFLAAVIDWPELLDELKRTLKGWGITADDIRTYQSKLWSQPKVYSEIKKDIDSITEDRLTLIEAVEKHKTLNSKLFDSKEMLKPKVRDKMLEIVDEFISNLKEQDIKIKVDDILLIGSNASYNYTKDSDIDLHILANTSATKYSKEIGQALYGAYRIIFNKQLDIKLFDIPLELFVETEDSPRVSNGVYSVKKNKWTKKPVQEDIPEYDKDALNALVGKWEAKCKDLFTDIDADALKDEKKVLKLLDDIYIKLRKKGIAKSEYSIENLAFKELRNKGYLDKLKEYRDVLVSKRLSLEERLDRSARMDMYNQICRACGSAPIIQDNGMFFVYNLREREVGAKVQALRKLPFIAEVHSNESGKYDFRDVGRTGLPSKYYNIRGQIK